MSVFWAILFGLAALLVIPLIFEWSRGARERNRSTLMQTGHTGSAYTAGSVDYTPGHPVRHSHDAGWGDSSDSCGSDGGGDGGGGD